MITENKNQDKNSEDKGLNNKVQQNTGLDTEKIPTEDSKDSNEAKGKPVNNGGVVTSKDDIHLEKQWLAVRDDYLGHYPELNDINTLYEPKGFDTLIDILAKRRQQTKEQIHEEIMNWPSSKQ